MKNKIKKTILNLIGVIFIFISIGSIINTFFRTGLSEILWMCYVSTFLIGIGILKRKSDLIFAQIYILTIPLLIWNIDFFSNLFTGNSIFGITNYFFTSYHNPLSKMFSLQHLFTIPASLYSIYLLKEKPSNKNLKISIIQISFIYLATRILTTPNENTNCVFKSCVSFLSSTEIYPLAWLFVSSLGIIGTFIVVNLSYNIIKNYYSG